MDDGFAVKAQVAPLIAFYFMACVIFECVIHAVDEGDAVCFACQHAQAEACHHGQAVGAGACLQLFCEIIGAHDHALKLGVCGDLGGVQHAQR